MHELAERLRIRLDAPAPSDDEQAELDGLLRRTLDTARETWPELELEAEAFVDALAERLDPQAPLVARLSELALVDLVLAFACATQRPGAIAAFERSYAKELRKVLEGGKARGIDAEDLQQHLRERLFVERDGRPARIGSYTGEGSLRAWVRVAATRLRIDVERRRWDLQTDLNSRRVASLADAAHGDLELSYLRARYRDAFARAFETAAGSLEPRERNLLRLNVVHGVSGTAIATLYGVHRATAKRWLVSARQALLERTRDELQRDLGLDSDELDSVMGLIRSRLELSIARVLGSVDDDVAPEPSDGG